MHTHISIITSIQWIKPHLPLIYYLDDIIHKVEEHFLC